MLTLAQDHTQAAQHYKGVLRELLAHKLVDALEALEQAHIDADKAHQYCGPADQQRTDMALLDCRVEAYRLMDQLGLDARIVGSALA